MSIATIMMVAIAGVAGADQWNDRTKLTFEAPIMIPGTTLAPGTYTFKLLDSQTSRHVVQVFNEDGTKLIATTHAVPAKRMDVSGDTMVKLNPTEAGAPIALKAWFYPGSRYGHEFVYSDQQARSIAQRTKTLVLSEDTPGDSDGKGTIYTYDAQGNRAGWKADEAMITEWRQWDEEGRKAAATVVAPTGGSSEGSKSTAPLVRSEPSGMPVSIGDLEDHPNQYIGKTISVTAEVDDVLGPRLFKIDEANWADLDGEILVSVPSALAALVREDDRVTVTGTMKMATKAEIERDVDWFSSSDEIVARFTERPVLVASNVVGGNNNVAMVLRVTETAENARNKADDKANNRADNKAGDNKAGNNAGDKPVGTSGTADSAAATTRGTAGAPLTDASAIGSGDRDLVGRHVDIAGAKVERTGKKHGFWVEAGGNTVFVLPGENAATRATAAGNSVAIQGVVLRMPRGMRDTAADNDKANDEIYILATSVK
jgi:hypothetical protein